MKRLRALRTLLLGVSCACQAGDTASPARVPLPEAPELPVEIQRRIAALPGAVGAPRTRHLNPDGSAKYTNRLILESSPYLQQHAHNPVNWYPWGNEAFAEALRLKRPLLLSVGYSTCHWCHVMEEESFEDEEIAAFINAHYVPIKVDREERPDLDQIYMEAVQRLTGRGGWPMTVWLTPDARPFFGGTYFPPRDGARGSRTGFLSLLRQLASSYAEEPERIEDTATRLTVELQRPTLQGSGAGLPDLALLDAAVASAAAAFDPAAGGRRGAPKFPSGLPLRLLLAHYGRTHDPETLRMVSLTLTKMSEGGIYDQLGGGFHRYSTDARWLVPHFEKMLYDNALLVVTYLEAWQATGDARLARVARQTLEWVARDMTSQEGGFYSATDADSSGPDGRREEGRYFTWTPAEIDAVLGPQVGLPFKSRYGVTAAGQLDGRSVLHVAAPGGDLDAARAKLLAARARRPAPLLDDKVLASWNGLMIQAMARGGFILDEPRFGRLAARAADFVLSRMRVEGRLRRSYRLGQARHDGYLDDYAFMIAGLLDLYETQSDPRWLREALELQATLDRYYRREAGGYFLSAADHEPLLARSVPDGDGAEPSGNSVALLNLLRLFDLTLREEYRGRAERLLAGFSGALRQNPAALPEMLLGVNFWLVSPYEVAIVSADRPAARPLLDVLRRRHIPTKVVAVVSEGAEAREVGALVPWIAGKVQRGGLPTAYVCRRGACRLPLSDPAQLAAELTWTEKSRGAAHAPDRALAPSVDTDVSGPRKK